MLKVITFFRKTHQQLTIAYLNLKKRYRSVSLIKEYYNGWYEGHFLVDEPYKTTTKRHEYV